MSEVTTNKQQTKWKSAFWICFSIWCITVICGLLYFINLELQSGYKSDRIHGMTSDIEKMAVILNKKLITFKEIETEFKKSDRIPFFNIEKNTASRSMMAPLFSVELHFRNDTLINIRKKD